MGASYAVSHLIEQGSPVALIVLQTFLSHITGPLMRNINVLSSILKDDLKYVCRNRRSPSENMGYGIWHVGVHDNA